MNACQWQSHTPILQAPSVPVGQGTWGSGHHLLGSLVPPGLSLPAQEGGFQHPAVSPLLDVCKRGKVRAWNFLGCGWKGAAMTVAGERKNFYNPCPPSLLPSTLSPTQLLCSFTLVAASEVVFFSTLTMVSF